jgi:hypothetical protein
MKLYPIRECVARAEKILNAGNPNTHIYQQWLCEHCGDHQTMEHPDVFFQAGTCEKCGQRTDIERAGCNYMLVTQRLPLDR